MTPVGMAATSGQEEESLQGGDAVCGAGHCGSADAVLLVLAFVGILVSKKLKLKNWVKLTPTH